MGWLNVLSPRQAHRRWRDSKVPAKLMTEVGLVLEARLQLCKLHADVHVCQQECGAM
jgi:hypothetical protein